VRDADLKPEVSTLNRPDSSRQARWLPRRLRARLRRAMDSVDRGDIIMGWLSRIVAGTALVAVIAFDGLSIGVAHVSAVDDANSAARAASTAWHDHDHDLQVALVAAQSAAASHGETVVAGSLSIQPDGTAHVTIRRMATTLIVRHVGALRSWTIISATGQGRYFDA
jgi:hypothetical protein